MKARQMMRILTHKKRAFGGVVVAGLVVVLLVMRASAPQARAEYSFDGPPKIIAATFSSAWCSSCKILEPRLADVTPDFSGKPVRFIELDFTFGEGDNQAAIAAEYGFADVYARFKKATGFTLLINAQSGEVVDMLTINHSPKAMRAAIAQSIAAAERAERPAP